MKSQDHITLAWSEVRNLRLVLEIAKEKILEYQEGKEEIDKSLADALYWIESGLSRPTKSVAQ